MVTTNADSIGSLSLLARSLHTIDAMEANLEHLRRRKVAELLDAAKDLLGRTATFTAIAEDTTPITLMVPARKSAHRVSGSKLYSYKGSDARSVFFTPGKIRLATTRGNIVGLDVVHGALVVKPDQTTTGDHNERHWVELSDGQSTLVSVQLEEPEGREFRET